MRGRNSKPFKAFNESGRSVLAVPGIRIDLFVFRHSTFQSTNKCRPHYFSAAGNHPPCLTNPLRYSI